MQVLGVFPHLLVQSAHEGRACLLGGCPLLSGWLGSCPTLSSPSLHAVPWGRTLLGRSPWGVGWILGAPPSFHAMRWERTQLRGCPLLVLLFWGYPFLWLRHGAVQGSLPSSWISPRAIGACSPSPALSYTWLWGVHLLLLEHALPWEHTLPYRGVPPSTWLGPRAVDAHGPSPTPSCPCVVFTRSCGGRRLPLPAPCLLGGS